MPKIEGFRIRNFKVLKDVTLGRLWNQRNIEPITPMTAVIGRNGVGKSVLFDAFGFLADALKSGVDEACDARGRGGFERLRTQGETGNIEFEVYYREHGNARPITYEIAIAVEQSGRPYVLLERLRQRRKGQKHGWPFSFLLLNRGRGLAWKGEKEGRQVDEGEEALDLEGLLNLVRLEGAEESAETESIELDDQRKLGIAHAWGLETTSENFSFSSLHRRLVSQLFHTRRCPRPSASWPPETSQRPW